MNHSIESFQLHAYLDGELSRQECLEIEHALEHDAELRNKLEQFSSLKHTLKKSYQNLAVPESKMPFSSKVKKRRFIPKSAVASLFLGVVLGAGFSSYSVNSSFTPVTFGQQQSAKYLVHLDSNDIEKQKAALQKIDELFSESNQQVEVDLISNFHGVELLDVNNPNNIELEALLNRYENLTVFACKRALARAQKEGKPFKLMKSAVQDQPAIDRLATRLNSGWNYIKI
ncbi:MAG TPA: hypothetical protein ENK73_06360 [Thiomicrospira sp.]|nr:hypothetical protein [Thiomicrospira sp.]